jgi:hypothetical protein
MHMITIPSQSLYRLLTGPGFSVCLLHPLCVSFILADGDPAFCISRCFSVNSYRLSRSADRDGEGRMRCVQK